MLRHGIGAATVGLVGLAPLAHAEPELTVAKADGCLDTVIAVVETPTPGPSLAEKVRGLGLPDLETLGPESDFLVFMDADVPDEVKIAALRKLWRVKAHYAEQDGLTRFTKY